MANYYLPKCCECEWNNAGEYMVTHEESSPSCRHRPSGGTGGRPDGHTTCNRVIGYGKTTIEAISEAREVLGL